VKLIDMDNDYCFLPLTVAFNSLTKEEILFAQLVVFNNNSTGSHGECRGYPFFMKYLQDQVPRVNLDNVLLLLSAEDVADVMYHYGRVDEAPEELPRENVQELANEALAKALYNTATKLLTSRKPRKAKKPSNATHLRGGTSKGRNTKHARKHASRTTTRKATTRKATTRRLRKVSQMRRPPQRPAISRKVMHSR
jgi:hypothetical protein